MLALVARDVQSIGDGEPGMDRENAGKLYDYGRMLTGVVRARSNDEEDPDALSPDELADKAEKLLAGLRSKQR